MRFKIVFSLAFMCLLQFGSQAQVCPNETNISNTNVCGTYGDGTGNSNWNRELNDPLNANYCENWYGRTSSSGFLVRMGSPFVNAGTGKLKAIADELDYIKAKGWELLLRKFGCQSDVSNPYFVLYNRYTGMLRVYVYLNPGSTSYSQILMAIKSVYDLRPATTSDASENLKAPDKYFKNEAGLASDEIVISLNESVGTNQWAVAEFYMMLDHNISELIYHNGSLEITIYGVTTSSLTATVQGTSSAGTSVKDAAFKTKNATIGGSTFNFTATGEKLISFSKSIDDFIKAINDNAKKLKTALDGNTDSLLQKLANVAKDVEKATSSTGDFNKVFSSASSFLGTAGQVLKFAGAVIGFLRGSSNSAASPSFTSYNLVVNGSISAQVVVQKFVIKIPGTSDPATNANNATYYNGPMGIFNLKTTPVVDTLSYDRRTLLPAGSNPRNVPRTTKYTAYRLNNALEVVVNSGAGLSLMSVEGALIAKVAVLPEDNTSSSTIWMGPLENFPKRGFYTHFNHMRADIEANRLEVTHYDSEGGGYHIIQTPFHSLECMSRATMNIHVPVMKIYLRLRAKLMRTDGLGEPIYFIKDYELDKQLGDVADIPWDISTNVSAIPPYANYTISPNTNSNIDLNGNVTGIDHDIKTAYAGNVTFSQPYEIRANRTISTSVNFWSNTLSNYYTTVTSGAPGVIFRAGGSVTLNPKFEATSGSVFLATVDWGYIDLGCTFPSLVTNYSYTGNTYNSSIVAQKSAPAVQAGEAQPVKASVYPNPAQDHVTILPGQEDRIENILVVDASGRAVNVVYNVGPKSIRLDVSQLATGSYIARIRFEKGTREYKFVILK